MATPVSIAIRTAIAAEKQAASLAEMAATVATLHAAIAEMARRLEAVETALRPPAVTVTGAGAGAGATPPDKKGRS